MEKSPRRIALRIAYDGTRFAGWQKQPEERTVQGIIERALGEMHGEPTRVQGASRTDAGVHAGGQVAHFDCASNIPLEGYVKGLNTLIDSDIAVLDASRAETDFHARFSAKGKNYRYAIYQAPTRHPLICRYAWHRHFPLDLDAMKKAAAAFIGEHDFAAFEAAGSDRDNTIRNVRRVDLSKDGEMLHIDVEATAFLHNMCRIIVGTLVEVGRGKIAAGDVPAIIDSRDRAQAGPTSPPMGLSLERVLY